MRAEIFSYRFAEEILQHSRHSGAWSEIIQTAKSSPLFIYPGKSKNNKLLDVVQQLQNAYFDRKFAIDLGWKFHPYATKIEDSGLTADFRKEFSGLSVQTEVQFGNMSRWYSDIFKFQAAYSAGMIQCGVSILPMTSLARRIDSNVANFERAKRELPSAVLSITLPILLIGLAADKSTRVVDVSKLSFSGLKEITGAKKVDNRWRIVNAHIKGTPITRVGSDSPTGPKLHIPENEIDAQQSDED